MLYGVFYWVLNISIAATLAGLLIAGMRRVKFIPKRLPYALWSIVFLRFITPFMYSSGISVMNLLTRLGTKTVVVTETVQRSIIFPQALEQNTDYLRITTANTVQFAKEYFPLVYKDSTEITGGIVSIFLTDTVYTAERINTLTAIFESAAIIWAIVAIAAFMTMSVLYFFTSREIRKAVHYSDNIYISEAFGTPAVCGILKQKIIIPHILDEETLANVILHEKVHIRRKDNLRRLIAITIACLHWFNPFVWLFLRAYFIDMELACDSGAVKGLDNERRKEYARTLLSFIPAKRTLVTCTFSGSNIKLRIEGVLSYKALSALSSVAFSVFAIAVAFAILTNAR